MKGIVGSAGRHRWGLSLGFLGVAALGAITVFATGLHYRNSPAVRSTTATAQSGARGCAQVKPLALTDSPFSAWSGLLQTAYPSIYGGYVDDSARPSGSVVILETRTDTCFENQARESLPLTSQGERVSVTFRIVPYSYAALASARSRLTACLMGDPGSTVWGVAVDSSEVVISAASLSKADASLQRCNVHMATKVEVGDPPVAS